MDNHRKLALGDLRIFSDVKEKKVVGGMNIALILFLREEMSYRLIFSCAFFPFSCQVGALKEEKKVCAISARLAFVVCLFF